MTRDEADRNVFAMDMAGLRDMSRKVLAKAADGVRVKPPPWTVVFSPADFQAVLDLAAEFPSEVGESQLLADLVDEGVTW